MGDAYLQIDCTDPEAAAAAVAALGDEVALDGVVAADDSGVVVAALAGTSLGLPANSPEAAAATRDKLVMRKLFSRAEVPQPEFRSLESDMDPIAAVAGLSFPLVVKPTDRSASQGVIRVDGPDNVAETIRAIRSIIGDPAATLLAEEYMGGDEVAVEGVIRDGELTVLAIFDKPDTRRGPAFPETIFVTPTRLTTPQVAECTRVAEAALTALGLAHGPVHIELRVDEGKARVIEVAARSIGGLCSRSLDFGLLGTSLEALILRNAIGMDKPELKRSNHASGVLMVPIPSSGTVVAIDGIEETRAIEGVSGVDITIKPGETVREPPYGDRYIGFVFARGRIPETVESSLRRAMNTLVVRVDS